MAHKPVGIRAHQYGSPQVEARSRFGRQQHIEIVVARPVRIRVGRPVLRNADGWRMRQTIPTRVLFQLHIVHLLRLRQIVNLKTHPQIRRIQQDKRTG